MARIEKIHSQRTMASLIQNFTNGSILIPRHQREYCWNLNSSEKAYTPSEREIHFIQSILKGHPIPSILLSTEGTGKLMLEDGRQRITCARNYKNNLFHVDWKDEKRTYDQLSTEDRIHFDNEVIPTVTYENASLSDKIEIFDRHQNGAPLSFGERYNVHDTELLHFTKEMFMTSEQGFHDDFIPYWGNQTRTDKRRKRLLCKIGLMIGLRHGPQSMNTKYEPIRGYITADYPVSVREKIKKDIQRILDIYASVEELCPLDPKKRNKWNKIYDDPGNFTGYILYSFSKDQEEYTPDALSEDDLHWGFIKQTWVDYIVSVRKEVEGQPPKKITAVLDTCIHKDMPKSRMWTIDRWRIGCSHVFHEPVDTLSEYDTVCDSSDDE